MKRQLMMGVGLACLAMGAVTVMAQPQPQPPNPNQVNDPTGTPPGVQPLQNRNSTGFPAPRLIPGQPIETRPPEKDDDHEVFAGQTRAPYKPSVAIKVETLTDQLKAPWSFALLPNNE